MSESTTVIAVPSDAEGGLDATRSGHFGHADGFTLVMLAAGVPTEVRVLANPHETGGCLSPVAMLASEGVDAIVVAGIGARPLAGFRQAGIAVHLDRTSATVAEAVRAFGEGRIGLLGDDGACAHHGEGHSGGCGGHHD